MTIVKARVRKIQVGTCEEVPLPTQQELDDNEIPRETFTIQMAENIGKEIEVEETEEGDYKDINCNYYHPSWLELVSELEQYMDTEILERSKKC